MDSCRSTPGHLTACRLQYVQTQLKLMKCVNENLNGMSEFLASKCRGEEDLDWYVHVMVVAWIDYSLTFGTSPQDCEKELPKKEFTQG